ncbi:MAG: hypothetical protein B7Z16_09280, partial [Algoriphagus sp. 32-45-6]
MSVIVKIRSIQSLTHDVKQFQVDKPDGYSFEPGQACEVAINQPNWKEEKRPFTFTSLPQEDHLEFVIKSYHDHDGVTKALDSLQVGDELIVDESWGAIQFKGKGTFIAGGAGITPFIAIFKDLYAKGQLAGNRLFFANKIGRFMVVKTEQTEPDTRVYKVIGQVFFASSDAFSRSFDFKEALPNIRIDLTQAHFWDITAVSALDKVVIKFRREGASVELIGMNAATAT